MKFVTFKTATTPARAGMVHGGMVYDLANTAEAVGVQLPASVLAWLHLGAPGHQLAAKVLALALDRGLPGCPITEAVVLAPVTDPPKILALAGNYQAHIQEAGHKAVDKNAITPRVFMKPITTLVGTKAPILLPPISRHVDYELELAIVIGAQGSRIPVANALDHVAGYAVYNDVSSRKLVISEGRSVRDGDGFYDWLMGKWQDNSGPMGPYLVTRDEVPDGDNLDMKLWVNGELRQNSNTSKMIFNIPEIVAFCSTLVTLQVGDIIATGTPSGVGDASGTYLKAGDVVRCEIEMLGVLENTVQGG